MPENRSRNVRIERKHFRSTPDAHVLAAPAPVHNAKCAARIAPEIGREGCSTNDPETHTVPMEPDRRFARTLLRTVGQVRVQRSGQKLIEIEERSISG